MINYAQLYKSSHAVFYEESYNGLFNDSVQVYIQLILELVNIFCIDS